MSQSFEKLSERGILPALAPGESTTFSPSLRDNSGNFLPIHFAASVRGIQPVIVNASVPAASAQVTFINQSDNAIAAGSPYIVESVHSIQIDPLLTTDRTAAVPVPASADLCQGSAFAFSNAAGNVAPGGNITLTTVNAFGSLGANVSVVGGRLRLPQATIARSWRLQGRIYVTAVGAEPNIDIDLFQDPDGAPSLLQRGSTSLGAAEDDVVSFDAVVTVPANPTDLQRSVGFILTGAAADVLIGNNPAGISLFASSL